MANGLTAEQVDAMLGLLSSDDDYRKLFVSDLGAALAKLPGSPGVPPNLPPDSCLKPAQLASKPDLARTRVLLARYGDQLEPFIPKLLEP